MKEKGDGLNFWLPTKTKEIEDDSYPLACTVNTRVLQDSIKDVRNLRVPWYWIVWHKLSHPRYGFASWIACHYQLPVLVW